MIFRYYVELREIQVIHNSFKRLPREQGQNFD